MTLERASLLLLCACLHLAALVAAIEPARVHEARQGPISTFALSAPGPASIQTSKTTLTMSQTSSSEPSPSSSSSASPSPSPNSSDTQTHASSSSGASASPSSSSATPRPSSSPGSLNISVQNMTTCTSGFISWNYTGEAAELLLSLTNIGVGQGSSRIAARQSAVLLQLVDTNTSALSYTWPSVNVIQGWYEIQGLVLASPTVTSESPPFFISNGTDVACLTSTSPQASSTASSGSSATSKTNVAGIVGGVIGGLVGVALAIIAGLYLWSRKRRRPFIRGEGRMGRKWGSLASTTSSIRPAGSGAQFTGGHLHAHTESTTGVLQDGSVGKVSATTTPGGSDEDVAAMGEEKLVSPVSPSGISPFDVLNTPVHYDRRASIYPASPAAVASDESRTRSASLHTSNQSLEQQAQRIRCSMETSVRRRSERLSMPTLPSAGLSRLHHSPTHTQPKEEYPLSPVTPAPVNRSISTSAVSVAARRASRKPVPQYDSSLFVEDTNADSVSTFTAGAESSSQSHGTGMGTGSHGTPTDLVHKASFGDGRPVHYLIPDMPPLQPED